MKVYSASQNMNNYAHCCRISNKITETVGRLFNLLKNGKSAPKTLLQIDNIDDFSNSEWGEDEEDERRRNVQNYRIFYSLSYIVPMYAYHVTFLHNHLPKLIPSMKKYYSQRGKANNPEVDEMQAIYKTLTKKAKL